MPSKLQIAMAAARPILAHAAGDVAYAVTTAGAGLVALPGEPNAIEEAIRAFLALPIADMQVMGQNARTHFRHNYSPAAGLDRLESMLRATVANAAAPVGMTTR